MNTDAITIEYGSGILSAEDFVDDGFILTESLCSDSQLAFGSCEAAAVEVQIASTAASFVGQTLIVKLGDNVLGRYKVVSDERASDGETRVLKAYDSLYEINGLDVAEWYAGIDWTLVTTLRQFRDSFFQYLGITQASGNLVNDNMAVSKTMETSSCSGATILRAICEINGVFGHINANGHFQYVSLAANNATTVNADEVLDTVTEDFTVPAFDSVLIRTEEGDIGGQYPTVGGNNQYIINDNFLCYGKSTLDLQTIAMNALTKIGGNSYVPFEAELECQGNIALGGKVTIPTEPDTFTSFVLQRKLVGFAALDEYFAAQGTPEYFPDVNSTRNQMIATAQRVNKLTTSLEGTRSEVAAIKGDYVTKGVLEQTEKIFTAQFEEVDKELQQITEELDGNINFYNVTEDISDKAKHPIERTYPSYNWTYNVICGVSVCGPNTKFEYTPEGLRKNLRSLAFNEATSESYRFVRENGEFLWKTVSDTDFGVAMARIASLEVSTEKIETDVKAQDAIITAQGTRITTAETNITQTSNAIQEEVKRAGAAEEEIKGSLELKIDRDENDQIVSMLNASANQINLTGNRVVINSDKFKVSKDGTVTATNANISGKIKSNEAEITGGSLAVGGKFSVDQDGTMRASGATIDGNLTSSNATITGGSLKVGSGFEVNTSGTLKASNADISGKITSSNANITGGTLKVGNNFSVSNAGVLKATNCEISGSIKSNSAEITGGKIDIESNDGSVITLRSDDGEGLTYRLDIDPASVTLQQDYPAAYTEITIGYGSIEVFKREGLVTSRVTITDNGIKVNGVSLLKESDTNWVVPSGWSMLRDGTYCTINPDGYKTLVLRGTLSSATPFHTITIPLIDLESLSVGGSAKYGFSEGSSSLVATITKNSNGTITIACSGSGLFTSSRWNSAYLQK